MKNSYKFLFFYMMILGILISITSNSWFAIWSGLEINLLSFIPLMSKTKNMFNTEASLKYFLIQALASNIFLFSILILLIYLNFKTNSKNMIFFLINSTILLKIGASPFHFWLPSVMEGLNWNSNLILMTLQKIAPLVIISYCMMIKMLIFIVILSAMFGALGGLNQTSLRKLLAFSSINHLSWMLMSIIYSENTWILYFLFYTLLNISIILILNNFKLFYMNQMFMMLNSNFFLKFNLFLTLLSLGGLPPFLGFFPKWMVIEMMIFMKMYFMIFILVFFTLITLYFYLRIMYFSLLMNHMIFNWTFKLNFIFKEMKNLLVITFFSLFGMILINLIYFLF